MHLLPVLSVIQDSTTQKALLAMARLAVRMIGSRYEWRFETCACTNRASLPILEKRERDGRIVKITLISRHLLLLGFAGLLTACSSGTSGGNTAGKSTPASITVGSNLNPSTVGQSVTFTAMIPAATPAITGSVTFMDGTTTLGTGTISGTTATYTASALAAGSHGITAVYGGDSNWNSITSTATTQTVNAAAKGTPASITVASNLNPSSEGQSVTFTATLPSATPAITGSVTYKDGATTLEPEPSPEPRPL